MPATSICAESSEELLAYIDDADIIMSKCELKHRGVAQLGSASALGAESRGFESHRPDQSSFGAER